MCLGEKTQWEKSALGMSHQKPGLREQELIVLRPGEVAQAIVQARRIVRVDSGIQVTRLRVSARVDHDGGILSLCYGHQHDLISLLTWLGHVGQVCSS